MASTMPLDRDHHRVAQAAEDVAEVVADPLDVEAGGVAEEGQHREQHQPHGTATFSRNGTRAEASWTRSQPSAMAVARPGRHCWVVRSRPYHCSDIFVSVPSSCMSATMPSTASKRLSDEGSELLSKPTESGS